MGKNKNKNKTKETTENEQEKDENDVATQAGSDVAKMPSRENVNDSDDDDSSSVSSEEDVDDLILEGVLKRNPDMPDSSSNGDDDDSSSDDDDDEEEEDTKGPPAKKRKGDHRNNHESKKQQSNHNRKKKQGKKNKKEIQKEDELEIVPVEFTFCDMNEKYFHGLKTMLTSTSPFYAGSSSELSDLMIENVSVGTVVGCEEGGDPDTVFGFASVLNIKESFPQDGNNSKQQSTLPALKKLCLDQCPKQHKTELETVFSGKTKRPAGLYLHGRMVNLPLEIVEVLHQQLVLDMDWAVEHAEGGVEERKSLDFGAFVRVAPSYRGDGTVYYKYFDDEVFADHAEFVYELNIPKTFGMEEAPYCMVIVMTKTGHRAAMKAMAKMVNSEQH